MGSQPPASVEQSGLFDITVDPNTGKVSYSLKENTPLWKRVAAAFGQTAGEAITPSLNDLGGEYNAQDYILKNYLANQGGESIPEALLKGAGEGIVRTFVPRSSADLQGEVAGLAGGSLLEGARGARAAAKAGQAAAKSGATAKLQAASQAKGATSASSRPLGQTTPSPGAGYHTRRMINRNMARQGVGPTARTGPRFSEKEIELSTKARADRSRKMPFGEDKLGPLMEPVTDVRGKMGTMRQMKGDALKELTGRSRAEQLEEGTQRMYNEQFGEGLKREIPEFGDAGDVALESAREYERLLDENPGAGAGRATHVGPFAEWLNKYPGQTLDQFTRWTGLR